MSLSRPFLVPLALALALPGLAHAAVAVDGRLDPDYGPPLVAQTTQTSRGDAGVPDYLGQVFGSELDAAYGYIAADTLHLFVAGNLYTALNPIDPGNIFDLLAVFLDTGSGGQDSVRADVADPNLGGLAGMKFDAGFRPSQAFLLSCAVLDPPHWFVVTQAAMPTGAASTTTYLGSSVMNQGPGTLLGGTNPFGVLAAIDDSNTAGVTAGCGAASGLGVTSGIEMAVPLAALGPTSGCVRVSALVYHRYNPTNAVTNQVLGPVPPGTCDLGPGGAVDFSAIPGDQFFTLCPRPAGVPAAAAPRLALSAAWPNPARGTVRCALSLERDGRVACTVVDVAGRRVATLLDGTLAAGTHELAWSGRRDDGARAGAGVYFVRAVVDGRPLARRLVVLAGE